MQKRSGIVLKVIIVFSFLVVGIVSILGKRYYTDAEKMNDIQFSHASGFYEEAFKLEIVNNNNKEGIIYYTLDGSEPDNKSMVYQEPIYITDATNNDNVYSIRTDVSTGLLSEKVEKYSTASSSYGYSIPDYNVDKATIVRAVMHYDDGECSDIITGSYFVDFQNKEGYEKMNVISIVTDPKNLFDYDNGIYVTGKTFDEYWVSRAEENVSWTDERWIWWPSNYRNRGKEWEREAYCHFYDTNGNLILEQSCGIRVHGGMSRGMTPKSLNLYAREEYDGNSFFRADVFGEGYYPSGITLSQGGNDSICKLNDYLFASLIYDLNVASMNFVPYAMFLDGEYWGIYWLTEKYDENYVSNRYGVYSENVVMIKNGELEDGKESDYDSYLEMYDICSSLDMEKEENYDKVCELIDIDSYIDYYASMLYVSRCGDWPSNNYALWRTRELERGTYGDCKWRWMVFDMNSKGMTSDLAEFDSIQSAMDQDAMFNNLMTSNTFRGRLIERIIELQEEVFNEERVSKVIDEYIILMKEPLLLNGKRFFNDSLENQIDKRIKLVRGFFIERNDHMEAILQKYR